MSDTVEKKCRPWYRGGHCWHLVGTVKKQTTCNASGTPTGRQRGYYRYVCCLCSMEDTSREVDYGW